MSGPVPVNFSPSGVTVWVTPGQTVLSAAKQAGVPISASCAGRGTCGECCVRVLEGELGAVEALEKRGLSRASAGIRLACQARVAGPVVVKPLVSPGVAVDNPATSFSGPLTAGVDLGTTNVNAVIVEIATGREVGAATVRNEQSSWGADILSRLGAAVAGESATLRAAAERSILSALEAACPACAGHIERLVVAGNTAMASLLTGVDVTSLVTHPFTAPDVVELPSDSALRDTLGPHASVDLVPPLASFVGGDVLAGLVAADIEAEDGHILLVDIGTNAEVVLAGSDELRVTSAAAGPAFEGGGISCGGPAVDGAVTRVSLDADHNVVLETIGDEEPRWFSGAGIISAVALLRRSGHLDSEGLLSEPGPLAGRFSRDSDGVLGVHLGTDGARLRVSQLDVRSVQIAKAAVRTAIEAVLGDAGVHARKLQALYVAGAFGGSLDAGQLVELGVVPRQARDVVRFVGNSSLRGAVALALDPGRWDRAVSLTQRVLHVELASDPQFAQRLMDAIALEPFSA